MINSIIHNYCHKHYFIPKNQCWENHDRPTNQQTDRQMDIRGHREVTLPIMIVVVGGMGEERWTRSSGGGLGGGG